jgi:histone deacetylase 1/2
MRDEFDALLQNNIWTLVPKPSGANVVSGKRVFHHKYNSNGTLSHYKERWVSHNSMGLILMRPFPYC